MRDRFEIKFNSIQNQLELLEMLQSRHNTWVSEKLELEIKQTHVEIIDLLGQTMKKYEALLKLYGKDNK